MASPGRLGTDAATFGTIVVAWGLNYLFVRWGVALAAPLWLALLRASVGAMGVLLALAVRPPSEPLRGRRRLAALALGVPNTALFFGLWFTAGAVVPPGIASVLVYTYPFWVAVLAVPWLGYRLQAPTLAGLLLGFAGVALISEPWRAGALRLPWVALVELLAAAVAWAVGTVLTQRFYRAWEMPAANGYQLLGGSVGLLVAAVVLTPHELPTPSWPLVGVVAWLGLVGTALAYSLWYRLLGRVHAATLSAYAFLVPIVTLVAAFALLGESLSPAQLVGVALVLGALYMVGRFGPLPPRTLAPPDERGRAVGSSESQA